MNDNLKLWAQVEKTDPSATKAATVSGQQITSISGAHMIKRATEMFGPVGLGWGWDIIEERYDQGGEIRNDKGDIIGREVGHVVRLRLWYELNGRRGEIEQYGCTPFAYKSKWGVTTDTEAPKKSLTDAIKKSLSMLGFSADIFMGLFDDPEYVAERKAEERIEKAEDQEAERERQQQERLDWLKASVALMESAASPNELTKLHAKFVRRVETLFSRKGEERDKANFMRRLEKALSERKAQLEQPETTP